MTPFFRSVVEREEVGSTSDLARELVLAGALALPAAVRARRQTAGRGRGTNRWFSADGSLTFTLALDPGALGLRRDHEPRLGLAAAVGIIEAVENLIPTHPPVIRWPNDVEVDGRKLAGLLTERVETPHGARLLLGIGLNVTTRFDAAPPDVAALATSLAALGASGIDVDRAFDRILGSFPGVLARLAGDDPGIARAWAGRDALLGEAVRLKVGNELIEGRGAGIDRDGALLLDGPSGRVAHHGGQVLR